MRRNTWPGGGNGPTSQWVPGAIYADSYLLPISPRAATPSELSLALYFWDDDPFTALAEPEVRVALERLGSEVRAGAPADLGGFLAREKTKWDEVVRQSGVTMN